MVKEEEEEIVKTTLRTLRGFNYFAVHRFLRSSSTQAPVDPRSTLDSISITSGEDFTDRRSPVES